jgi:hypothetical protein
LPAAATVAIATIDHVKKPSCFAKSRNFQRLDDDGHPNNVGRRTVSFPTVQTTPISVRATFTHTED